MEETKKRELFESVFEGFAGDANMYIAQITFMTLRRGNEMDVGRFFELLSFARILGATLHCEGAEPTLRKAIVDILGDEKQFNESVKDTLVLISEMKPHEFPQLLRDSQRQFEEGDSNFRGGYRADMLFHIIKAVYLCKDILIKVLILSDEKSTSN